MSTLEPPRILPDQGLWGGRLLLFDSLPSTNQWALEHAGQSQNGDVIRARLQTAGRGRFNRHWLSPGTRELTLSVCIHEAGAHPSTAALVGSAAALAVRTAAQAHGIPAKVKWPNDVLAGGAKLAGILSERDLRHGIIVVGIGLNLNLRPSDLADTPLLQSATSIGMETGRAIDPERAMELLLPALATYFALATAGRHHNLQAEWAAHDSLVGKRVRVASAEGTHEGFYAGITAEGALRLKMPDGQERLLLAGDATLAIPVNRE